MQTRTALFAIMVSSAFLWSGLSSAVGVYDGDWEGETVQGHQIEFTVENDVITYFSYGATYNCPTGATPGWGFGSSPQSPITNGAFEILRGIDGNHIADGDSIPAIIEGNFPSTTQAAGTLQAAVAAFTGKGLNTQSCVFSGTWTAQQVNMQPSFVDPNDPLAYEYSFPLPPQQE